MSAMPAPHDSCLPFPAFLVINNTAPSEALTQEIRTKKPNLYPTNTLWMKCSRFRPVPSARHRLRKPPVFALLTPKKNVVLPCSPTAETPRWVGCAFPRSVLGYASSGQEDRSGGET